MKMVLERLVPGVQYGDNPKGSAQTASAKLDQRLADRFKQKSQDDPLVGKDQAVELMGQGENQVKVSHRQKLGGLFFQPPSFCQGLALGTVAVAAGVVNRALKIARIAAIQVSAKLFGPADLHGPDHFVLSGRHPIRLLEALPVAAKDIGQLGTRSSFSCRQLGTGQRHGNTRLKRGVS
jgi:hypothetical protein